MSEELWRQSACSVVELLKSGDVQPADLIEIAAARIEQTNPIVNSVVTTCFDRAMRHASDIRSCKAPSGLLHGLPVVIKDLDDVAGVRTTYGSPIYADHVPAASSAAVQALEAQGAIVIGKSNTPEFGAGANTFNDVFGTTVSPWDSVKTCGGSSGGSATALATGQAWLASGSDLGGSLRIPAAFCGVVGLRPSPGRVPRWPTATPFDPQSVVGPMARSVSDLGLMLDAMSVLDARDPLSFKTPENVFRQAAQTPLVPRRVAWTPDLGGCAPVDSEVRKICAEAVASLAALGSEVTSECPDFSRASDIFQVTRAHGMAVQHRDNYAQHKSRLKPDLLWNIEKGQGLTMSELVKAEADRANLYQAMAHFFESHDLLITPTVMVPPFDATERYVTEVAGVVFDN
ncbi:MAG: amidase family protein, partial [Burkholderiaceae bacterium]